ncbi:MAG: prephenate dehydratase [Rhodospirillales bacterium]|nr:prephenate dehydratase [Rhodospirillales bacterium]MDH3792072.1 prephenate dehydratase [Rhodospirillales bacterium]MDH3912167.1 prephenate dehydratase [Rhodospirillales bacterium]MDH3918867.1 prephenate dehydratase [Rhodospirillales bacterium]MDH3967208.1 prephenate dehydratase [Rhodospirillales bacterium]
MTAADPQKLIAFQGVHGAYSDMACRSAHPELSTLPCPSFEDTFAAVRDGRAELAMIPIENSSAGRVADIHHLLPESGLHIVGEHFERVNHQLLAPKGATLGGLEVVRSHVQALSQCREFIRSHGIKPVVYADTAGAAAEVAALNDPAQAAIASALAGEIYALEVLKGDIEDAEHNTTRFLVMAREPVDPDPAGGLVITSFVFRVRSVPAALYKALGGFATNGVNITKLESYIVDGSFNVAQFYADIEGHPDQRPVRLALEELSFFSREVRILGVYHAAPFRGGELSAGGL